MAVVLDIVDGHRVSRDRDGVTITRVARIDGLQAAGPGRLIEAVNARGIPEWDEVHPHVPGVIVTGLHAENMANDPSLAEVVITYQSLGSAGGTVQPDPTDDVGQATIEVGATVVGTQTNKDVKGNIINVQRDFQVGELNPRTGKTIEGSSVVIQQGGRITVNRPQNTLGFTRRENRAPHARSKRYTGMLNSKSFFFEAPKFWLCMGITGVSDDGGRTYDVDYRFQFDAEQWTATVVYVMPDGTLATGDLNFLVADGSYKIFDVYEQDDFNLLQLGGTPLNPAGGFQPVLP